jgi:hypothetical protein
MAVLSRGKAEVLLFAAFVLFAVGFITGRASTVKPVPVVKPAAAKVFSPGNQVLERKTEPPPAEALPPEIPKGATVTRAASFTIQPMEALPGPVHVNVVELETAEGSRLQVQTPDGRIIGGTDYARPLRPAPEPGPWSAGLGAIVTRDGPQPAAVVSWTRGPWTLGTVAGLKSGPAWPGVGVYVTFRF